MTQSTDVWRLAVAELALYIVILPVVIYILIRHGKHGIDGWGFLAVFCILRLTSSGIQVGSKNETSTTGAIVNSIGVSGLLLAFAGILHEVGRTYTLFRPRLGKVLALWFHILVVTGIVLAAIGGSNLTKSGRTSDERAKDHNLQKAGYSLLVLSVASLFVATFILLFRLRTQVHQRKATGTKLLYFVLMALVFGLIRVVYGLVAAVSTSRDLSPVTGTFAVKVVLIFLVQIIATLLLVIGGLQSRNMRHEIKQVPGERLQAQYG